MLFFDNFMEIRTSFTAAARWILQGRIPRGFVLEFPQMTFKFKKRVDLTCDLDIDTGVTVGCQFSREQFVDDLQEIVPYELLWNCSWDKGLKEYIIANKAGFKVPMQINEIKVELAQEALSYGEELRLEFFKMIDAYSISDEERQNYIQGEVKRIARHCISKIASNNDLTASDYVLVRPNERFGDEKTLREIDERLSNIFYQENPHLEFTVTFSMGKTPDMFNTITISVTRKI